MTNRDIKKALKMLYWEKKKLDQKIQAFGDDPILICRRGEYAAAIRVIEKYVEITKM